MANLWGALEIVLSDEAAKEVDVASAKHNRFEDAWRGLEWLLARSHEVGSVATVNGTEWWVYVEPSDLVAKTPVIWVLYRVTKTQVLIEAINVQKPS